MAVAEDHATHGVAASSRDVPGDRSVSSAIEHLVASSQGVITKRIDLALLEGQDVLSRTLKRAALVSCAILLAVGAWFAVAACGVLLVTPDANLIVRLAGFGLFNALAAFGLVAFAMRGRPQAVGANDRFPSKPTEPQR